MALSGLMNVSKLFGRFVNLRERFVKQSGRRAECGN
jgi:hypothetical protein